MLGSKGRFQTDLFTKTMISDYMFIKDRLFAALNLDDKEMSLYNSVATILEKNVSVPDMVIFLQSDTERLMQNIKIRGREYRKANPEKVRESVRKYRKVRSEKRAQKKVGLKKIPKCRLMEETQKCHSGLPVCQFPRRFCRTIHLWHIDRSAKPPGKLTDIDQANGTFENRQTY